MISSWGSQQSDCCKWNGVSCSNQTGHVIRLDLHGHVSPEYNKNFYCLQGIIDDSLADLKHLEYLDLSSNMLKSQSIPSFIGSLSNLKYLNLSRPYYSLGDLPQDLVNLSQLITLDLSGIDLSHAMGWFDIINTLPSLTNVWLDTCNLPSISYEPLFQINSSSKFEVISLAENDLHDSYFIQWLFNLSTVNVHLKHIDLSRNSIEGTFPVTIGKLESLEFLDFSGNSISGPIPNTLTNMHALSYLDLSDNNLEGIIPAGMEKLEFLKYLDLSYNSLVGSIPSTFRYMHVLSYLDLSNNKLEGHIPSEFGDLNSVLVHLDLSNNRLTGMIPDTIGNLKFVTLLSLSNNLISGIIPDFVELISPLTTLNLANNLFIGAIPSQLGMFQQLDFVDLSFNRLSGPIPSTLEIFGVEAFEGNVNLRGLLLSTVCPIEQGDVSSEQTSEGNFYLGLYVSIGLASFLDSGEFVLLSFSRIHGGIPFSAFLIASSIKFI
ncbi:unnamed protein product [Amaranthus hypochondriacus]